MDYYDKIRAAMWQFRNEKRAIQTGCVWHNEWTEKYITKEGTPSGGHSFAIIGWKEDYLKIQNSVGVNIGNNGIQWIHKDLVNKLFTFGAIMFLDKPNMTDEEILKKSEEYRLKKNTILEKIISLLNKIISLMKKQIKIKKEPIKDILLDNQKDIKDISNKQDKFLWNTKEQSRHSSRVIMDEFQLSKMQKDLLCQVINCESGFNIKAKNENFNKENKLISTDWGICQINDFYWIGKDKYFSSVEEVLNKPEKSVRFMCKQFLAGHLNWWVCYKNGAYQKF